MIHLPHTDALCALTQPYCLDSVPEGLFDRAMGEVSLFHCHHTPGYERWLNSNGLVAQDLATLDDWSRLPPIFAHYFKRHLLFGPTGEGALELTSSGTSGQKSRLRYDQRSMAAAQGMVSHIFRHYGWDTPDSPCNYLLLSYEPKAAITLGTAYTDQFLCSYAPVNRIAYGLRLTGNGHAFDVFGVIRALQEFAEEGLPVRILGFPAFLSHALQHMEDTGVADLKLAAESLVFLGGGLENPGRTGNSFVAVVSTHPPPIGHRPVPLPGRLRRCRACRALHPVCSAAFPCAGVFEGLRAQPIQFHCSTLRSARLVGVRVAVHFVQPRARRCHGRPGDAAPRCQLRMRLADRLV